VFRAENYMTYFEEQVIIDPGFAFDEIRKVEPSLQ
jgi:hypothetical protein